LKKIKIAQTEKKNWKDELDTYLMMYRSSLHCVTGTSPLNLKFGRKMGTKIPQVFDCHMGGFEVHDRDAEMKEKGKDYGDKRRVCSECDYSPGNKALVEHRGNKMDTTFKMEPMVVKAKHGIVPF
jgi:hypothetical protein